jgi:hypothetical protein
MHPKKERKESFHERVNIKLTPSDPLLRPYVYCVPPDLTFKNSSLCQQSECMCFFLKRISENGLLFPYLALTDGFKVTTEMLFTTRYATEYVRVIKVNV